MDVTEQGMPPAILLGGETISLSVARSLGPHGVRVLGLGHHSDPLRYSRHCAAYTAIPLGVEGQRRVLSWLEEEGPGQGVLLPCDDDGLELVARNRERIGALGYLPIEANDSALLAMLDKQRTHELARSAGVETPRSAVVRSPGEAAAAADEIGYPCALKPLHSHHFALHFGLLQKAFVARDRSGLDAALEHVRGLDLAMMVTEIIPGPDAGFSSFYSYLDERGEPLFGITKRKSRQFPPGFGLGCYHLTDWLPETAELGLRFFRGAGLRGLVNVEFKRDSRDGRLKLIECNHRFTAATELLRTCGADVALFTYERLLGRQGPSMDGYRLGVGYWYPLRDVRAFIAYRRRGELTLGRWLRSLMRPQRFPAARLDDPLPSLVTGLRWLGRRLRRRR